MGFLKQFSTLPLAFGGASISGEGGGYGFGSISDHDAISLLHEAFDLGVRVFDSAPIYGFGLSEKRMGQALKNYREKVCLISKSGVTWGENKRVDMTNDPGVTEKMLHQSLKDFNSDYIDLYMIHWPDSRVDIRGPLEVLSKAKLQGKIRAIGLCNTNAEDLNKAFEIDKIEVVQSQFNLFENTEVQNLFPLFREKNIEFMSWGTLDKGIITGTVTKDRKFEAADCRSWAPWWKQTDFEYRYRTLDKLKPLLERFGVSGLELALKFNLSYPELTMAICGVRNSKQLQGVVQAMNKDLTPEFLQEVKNLVK